MNLFTLQSINRLTYFLGIVVINVISSSFLYLAKGNFADQNMITASVIISSFFGLVKIIWDYKRIKDISTNQSYLLLLIIPVIAEVVTLITRNGGTDSITSMLGNVNARPMPVLIILGILLLFSLCYRLFLFFKKGYSNITLQPIPEVKM